MPKFYITYFIKHGDKGVYGEDVVTATSLEDAKKMSPNKEKFVLPDYEDENGWQVCHTFYEYIIQVPYYMERWADEEILNYYYHNLTQMRKNGYEVSRSSKSEKFQILHVLLFYTMYIIDTFCDMVESFFKLIFKK